eukprot:CAMPEP_0167745866 /NCGR_PEP_ID=MMETSP0110_2-20121227/3388_1 /TAXON_ID=629695 /ORGANISM="Gymnochlora sp., Strain CCMP2014" /LENGTH=243 /DNA_ID=CAMNT_0007630553 /DNA_START=110 /DNA_END=841 /DNA_ORIENTATION=+
MRQMSSNANEYDHLDETECLTRLSKLIWRANENVNIVSRKSNTSPELLFQQHVLDCLPLVDVIQEKVGSLDSGIRILDVGSGGGFPALVLAAVRPEWKITMLEATSKKCDVLTSVSIGMDLRNTKVQAGRAEDIGHQFGWRESFPVVTARAVAELRTLAELCLSFVEVGGLMFAMKGPVEQAEMEMKAAEKAIEEMGGKIEDLVEIDANMKELGLRTVVVIRKVSSTPSKYPRGVGRPNKRPL